MFKPMTSYSYNPLTEDLDLGRHRRARTELERLYAEGQDYENVAARLKLQKRPGSCDK